MGSHSVTCHPAEATFPPLPQPKLVLDLATPKRCKAEVNSAEVNSLRPENGSDVTGFGSYDNITCKSVLDQLEPGDLRFGQVVIKRVAVVELGVNNGSDDGGCCFGIKVWTDTAKLTDMVLADLETDEIWSEKVRCSLNMMPRFRAE